MIEIATAITAKFTTGTPAFNTDLSGRMWFMRAPQNVIFPYCIFSIVDNNPGWSFTTEYQEATVQFSIYDRASDMSQRALSTIMTAQKDLWALYDFAALALTGYSLTIMMRRRNMILEDPEPGVAHSMTQYYLRFAK